MRHLTLLALAAFAAAAIAGCGSSSQETVAASNQATTKQVSVPQPTATPTRAPAVKLKPRRSKKYPFKVTITGDPNNPDHVVITVVNITNQAVGPFGVSFIGATESSGGVTELQPTNIVTSDHQKLDPVFANSSSKAFVVKALAPHDAYTVTTAYAKQPDRVCVQTTVYLIWQRDLTPYKEPSICGQ